MSSSGPRRPPPTGPAAFGASSPAPEEAYDHLVEVPVTREQLNHYRNVAEAARSELAATLVKFESAQSELRELRSKMLSKEASCQELKAEMESYKENNARKSSLLISLRDRVQELEEESAALSTSKIRTEITAQSAIKEKQELKKKVVELDEKLQKCLKENEENKNQVSQNCRKHEEFLAQLRDCLDPEKNEEASDEDLILKLGELCKENAFVKGQIVALEETINVHEMEAKASRETIMRLASEVNREQKKAASYIEEKGQLSQAMKGVLELAGRSEGAIFVGNPEAFHVYGDVTAKDLLGAVEAKEALEREVKVFQERLLAGQRVWDASKQELSVLKRSSSELEKSLKASLEATAASQTKLSSFREKIAALLRGSWGTLRPSEDAILERIREMGSQEESRKQVNYGMEVSKNLRVERLNFRLRVQYETTFSVVQKHVSSLVQCTIIRVLEVTLYIVLDAFFLLRSDLLLMVSQLEAQISKLVEQLGNESQFHQKALQRAQKAENKLETLQGQLTHLEEELVSGGVLRDDLNFEKQKYLKFLDQLSEKMKLDQMAAELGFDMRLDVVLARTEQLVRLESNAIIENKTIAHNLQRKLKTQKERLESKELHMNLLRQKIAHLEQEKQIKTLEQTKAIEDLNKSRDKLEKMKEKAEKKLLSVKSELETTEHEAKENKERARNMLEVVTSEMKTVKKSLEEAEKRERQLVDFREVVSQMLGLNMMSLALPDYEIIKCLERLIHAHQHHFVTCACLKDVTAKQDRPPQGHLQLPH
ncbi:hypothetical protein MJT46_008737 [Ovis ammon polii x Ovis aries]|nr:hypothetical protein MJT46_008737 [Ovis ammon polii x Ovis aries]